MAHSSQQIVFVDEGDRPRLELAKGSVVATFGAGSGMPPWAHFPSLDEAEAWADDFVQQVCLLKQQVRGQLQTDDLYDAFTAGAA